MIPAPKRRWSFSLRTLFVVVTVACVWLGYDLNWIRERHALLARRAEFRTVYDQKIAVSDHDDAVIGNRIAVGQPTSAGRWHLWVLGEAAIDSIDFVFFAGPSDSEWQEVELARRLFPEAEIEWRMIELKWNCKPPEPLSTSIPATH